jgi:hypothetical protein
VTGVTSTNKNGPATIRAEPEKSRKKTRKKNGGAEENRTPGLDIANVALSQLSYGPTRAPGA